MIETLIVRNIGSIRAAHIDFTGNFIVITGESGAGKSSLLRAMEFITGQRAQTGMININENTCEVIMSYQTDNAISIDDTSIDTTENIIVKRQFNKSGKGKATIQSVPVPIHVLNDIVKEEIVIQNQFAQVNLLDPSKQKEILDLSCPDTSLSDKLNLLSQTIKHLIKCEKDILIVKQRQKKYEKKYENINKVLPVVQKMNICPDSEQLYECELNKLDLYASQLEKLQMLRYKINAHRENDLLSTMEDIARDIQTLTIKCDSYKCLVDESEKVLISIQKLSRYLDDIIGTIESPDELNATRELVEQKLGAIRHLRRILKLDTCSQILEYVKEASDDLKWLKGSWNTLKSLEQQSVQMKKQLVQYAREVREKRKELAFSLSIKVNKHLKDMAMSNYIFSINIEELDRITVDGAENVSFMIALKGQTPFPIHKNASGGELSRILLALQLSMNENRLPSTIVFDEIEAGLGGKTAILAGKKLLELSKTCQTILITHEATIATMADQHFVVTKSTKGSTVKEVKDCDREQEIARMLSGDVSSQEAITHAQALLEV